MNRNAHGWARRGRWLQALLPLLLLRALVPAGFMPAVDAGSLAIVFCEPGTVAAAPHARHHHDPGGGGVGGHAMSGECPFAQSAGPALPGTPAPLASRVPLVHVPPAPLPDFAVTRTPLRYAAARGPPAPPEP